ncbi:MAG: 2-oxo acid dehydrogenase subunit E2 [Clostridia bacterium]|nr:2-oxo acid dehydrogenase subunit E2 [Clostridia bacterium]
MGKFKDFVTDVTHGPVEGDRIEYFNLKAKISGNVLTNAQDMPTPGYTYDADVTKFWEEFRKLKAECDYNLTFNDLMMRAMVEGLKVAPRLNSYIEYNRLCTTGKLIIKKHIDIAVPILLETGETFPVKVRDCEEKSLKEISLRTAELARLVQTADVDRVLFDLLTKRTLGFILKGKIISTVAQTLAGYIGKGRVATVKGIFEHAPRGEGCLSPDDLDEGTVCLTNLGAVNKSLNGRVTNAPLLFPQVFLMAVGVARDENYVYKNDKGEIEMGTRKTLPITLTFDHRVGGFGDILPYIKKLDEIFSNPEIIREW